MFTPHPHHHLGINQSVIFIDAAVSTDQTLIDGLAPNAQVVLLSDGDALAQIAAVLSG